MATAPPLPKSFEEAAQLRVEVEAELERVCASDQFRSSRRCSEFLQYVVQVTLDGRPDSLKERSIGLDLLGRDTSYDPSSDSTVRVRANDVRKRLGTYYNSASTEGPVRIVLPIGSYVPHFVPALPDLANRASEAPAAQTIQFAVSPRSRLLKASLVLFAVLSCILLIRYRLESRDRYETFWKQVLTGKKVVLLSMTDETRERLGSGLYPLVWISGRFGVPTVLTSGSLTGATTTTFAKARISSEPPVDLQKDKRLKWLLYGSENPILIIRDPTGQISNSSITHAALLTILPESPSILYVQSTDEDALRKVLEELTEREHFPRGLAVPTSGPLQVLLIVDAGGHTSTQMWEPKV